MAVLDGRLQSYVKTFFVPAVVVIILLRLSRRQLHRLYSKIYAYFINKYSRKYNRTMGARKEKLFTGLHDQVKQAGRRISILEIGAGSGANFKYYPKNASVTCVDPNPDFGKYLEENMAQHPGVTVVESVVGSAEDMSSIPSGSIDAVVSTLVLCSVVNVDAALKETVRVLRPGGIFYFMEHVGADEGTWLLTLQRLLSPFARYFIECNMTRKTCTMIETANFSKVNMERFHAELAAPLKPHISGIAIK